MIEGYTSTPTGFHLKSLVLAYTPAIRCKSVENEKSGKSPQGGTVPLFYCLTPTYAKSYVKMFVGTSLVVPYSCTMY